MNGRGHPPSQRGEAVLDDVPVALLVADVDGAVTDANRAWAALSGLTHDDSIGSGWLAAVDVPDRGAVQAALRDVSQQGAATVEVGLIGGAGVRSTRWELATRRGGDGIVIAIVDLTEENRRRDELERRATHDPLTGLFNRTEFLAFVGHALRRLERHPGRISVLFVDLDGFKSVNDHYGHRVGDEVLIAAARRLRAAVRPEDVVARIGGDEFAILCEDLSFTGSDQMPARVREAFDDPLASDDGATFAIGASVGAAASGRPETRPEALLDAADRAMYATKSAKPVVTPGADGHGPAHVEDPRSGIRIDVADELIRDLSAIGLTLATCASVIDGPVLSRLTAAIDDHDRIVRALRAATFERRTGSATAADEPHRQPWATTERASHERTWPDRADDTVRVRRADHVGVAPVGVASVGVASGASAPPGRTAAHSAPARDPAGEHIVPVTAVLADPDDAPPGRAT